MTTIYIMPTLGDSACIPFPESMFYRQIYYMSTALINSNCFRNRTLGDTVHTLVSKTMFYRQTQFTNYIHCPCR